MGHRVKPQNLILRGRTYYFRTLVPLKLVSLLGRREYKKTLATGDYKTAIRLCRRYSNFTEGYFDFVMKMRPPPEEIEFLIRTHFEKCLMNAEHAIWLSREALRHEGEGLRDIENALHSLQAQHKQLQIAAMTAEYSPALENAAAELLTWQGWELSPLDDLYEELVRGMADAQLEALRLHQTYLSHDTSGMTIQSPRFKDCHNYLQYPDHDAFIGYENKSYHGVATLGDTQTQRASITLGQAVEQYMRDKQRENNDWHRAQAAYLGRVIDILGKDALLGCLTEENGFKLEEMLWKIPAHYTKLYNDVELIEFINNPDEDYETISKTTVKMYWQAWKAFFKWCEYRKFTTNNILAEIKLNLPKTGASDARYYPFSPEQLQQFFHCPLYTGHKYENQRFWLKGTQLARNGNYWIPLVGLFAGLRLGEILYLQIKDIKTDKGIAYIDVNKEEGKSLKTFQSARKIPIHPTLIDIGFLNYCEKRKAITDEKDRLFDGISYPDNQKITKNYSRNFSKLLTNIGIKSDRHLAFYSFRHNYVSALRRLKVSAEIMDPLDGRFTTREERGSRARYGHDFMPHELYPHIAKMDMRVDLQHLR